MSKKQSNGTATFDRQKRQVYRGPNNCTEKQAGKRCWEANSTDDRKTKAGELGTSNNKRPNGYFNYNSSSSSSEENSDPESSEQDSLDSSTSDANSSLNAAHLSEAQAQFLKRYRTKNKERIVSSADSYSDSSEDESKVANTTKITKKLSKHKKKSVPKHFEVESQKSESDGTSSSSADSDGGDTTESMFGSCSSSSDSDESTNTQCPGREESLHSTRDEHDSDEEYRLYKSVNLNARKRSPYRTRSLPTLLDHAAMTSRSRSPDDSRTDPPLPGSLAQQLVGNLRWPFTNLYVKELQIASDLDEGELDESQHESETSSLPNSTSLSFPGRQKNIMLGRVWTPAWWAVNSGLAGEHVTYTDVDDIL